MGIEVAAQKLFTDLASALAVVSFRAVPFVGYALVKSGVGVHRRLFVVLGFAAVVTFVASMHVSVEAVLVGAPVALGYFALVGVAVHRWLSDLARKPALRPAVFGLLGVTCLLIPALFIRGPFLAPTLLVGWGVMLSGYSYCVDNAAARSRPTLNKCLFFLLVNPTLVYAERGAPQSGSDQTMRGLVRCAVGLGAWLAQGALTRLIGANQPTNPRELFGISDGASYLSFIMHYSGLFLAYYLAHSGLASILIGFMALAGYRVPECYRYPFLATSPKDFWQRWNIWVAAWARRYVFFPLSLRLRRKHRLNSEVGTAVAVIATFVTAGLLHDVVTYARQAAEPISSWSLPGGLVLFGLSGLILVAWIGCIRLVRAAGVPLVLGRLWPPVAHVVGAAALLHALYLTHATATWVGSNHSRTIRTSDG